MGGASLSAHFWCYNISAPRTYDTIVGGSTYLTCDTRINSAPSSPANSAWTVQTISIQMVFVCASELHARLHSHLCVDKLAPLAKDACDDVYDCGRLAVGDTSA